MIHVFELKSREEHWLLFKYLKLVAIFVGTYAAFFLILLYLGANRRTRSGIQEVTSGNTELLMDIAFYLSIAMVALYVLSKLRYPEVERFEFNDSVGKLRISYRNFFTHYRWKKLYFYSDLDYKNSFRKDLVNGEYDHIIIFAANKKIAVIHGAANDWHKLPKTTLELRRKLWSIRREIHGIDEIFTDHLPKYSVASLKS